MSTAFDSFVRSAFGGFIRSPLGVRGRLNMICYMDLDGTNPMFEMTYDGNEVFYATLTDINANTVVAFRSFQDETAGCMNPEGYPTANTVAPIGVCHNIRVTPSCTLETTDIFPSREHYYCYEDHDYPSANAGQGWGEIYRSGFGFGIGLGGSIPGFSPDGLIAYVQCSRSSFQDALPSTSCSGFSPALPSDVDSVNDFGASGNPSLGIFLFKRDAVGDEWEQHTEYPYRQFYYGDIGSTGSSRLTLGPGGLMWKSPGDSVGASSTKLRVVDALTNPSGASFTTLTAASGVTYIRIFHSATVTLATQSNGDVQVYSGTTLIQTLAPGSGTVTSATECGGWLALQRGGTLYWYKWNSGTSQYDSHSSTTEAAPPVQTFFPSVRVMTSGRALENGRYMWRYSSDTDSWSRGSSDLRDDLDPIAFGWWVYRLADDSVWMRDLYFTRAAFRRF